jgi:hypothetical protein
MPVWNRPRAIHPRDARDAPGFAEEIANVVGFERRVFSPSRVLNWTTASGLPFREIESNTPSSRELRRTTDVVPALLRHTAVSRFIETGADVA